MVTTTQTNANDTYVFDQAWQRELERLRLLEALFDPASRRYLAAVGVGPGWRCLEVGCGAGGVALWLADRVGPEGGVVATDLDPRFLEGHGRPNLEVRRHDLLSDPLEPGGFDLVHARAVVMHVADRERALAHLVAALKPGGWLVLEDVHFGGAAAALLARYTVSAAEVPAWERLWRAAAAVFVAAGADPSFGERLPAALLGAGLEEVGAEVHAPLVAGGPAAGFIPLSVEHLRPRLLALGLATEAELEHWRRVFADPSTRYLMLLMVTAWGRRGRTSG
jgi:SAM-dependent methyltransferase